MIIKVQREFAKLSGQYIYEIELINTVLIQMSAGAPTPIYSQLDKLLQKHTSPFHVIPYSSDPANHPSYPHAEPSEKSDPSTCPPDLSGIRTPRPNDSNPCCPCTTIRINPELETKKCLSCSMENAGPAEPANIEHENGCVPGDEDNGAASESGDARARLLLVRRRRECRERVRVSRACDRCKR